MTVCIDDHGARIYFLVAKLRLTLACWNYDRTRALLEGRIQPDGVDLTYLNLPVEETFFRMLRYREFDAAEMSLSWRLEILWAEIAQLVSGRGTCSASTNSPGCRSFFM